MSQVNKAVESAFGFVCQRGPATINHRGVHPKVTANWCEPESEGARRSNAK